MFSLKTSAFCARSASPGGICFGLRYEMFGLAHSSYVSGCVCFKSFVGFVLSKAQRFDFVCLRVQDVRVCTVGFGGLRVQDVQGYSAREGT